MNYKKKLEVQRARMRAECKRNHETQLRKNKEKRERQFEERQERRELEKLRQELHERNQREREAAREQELKAARVQEVKEQWREVMDEKEKQARDLLGITWQQPITEPVVKAFARERSKELHPDQNPGIDPQRYVRMMEARDYLMEQLKEAS